MSAERFTLDTNILVYSIDQADPVRHVQAMEIIERAVCLDCHLTLQAISEFFAAATRKCRMPAADAAAQAQDWLDLFPTLAASPECVRTALTAAAAGRTSYWDGLLLATAREGGCTTMLSEDLADGTRTLEVRIVNPFGRAGLSQAAEALLVAPAAG